MKDLCSGTKVAFPPVHRMFLWSEGLSEQPRSRFREYYDYGLNSSDADDFWAYWFAIV